MNEEQIIKLIWDEYHHAYEGIGRSSGLTITYFQFTGHAQCALNILSQLGEDCNKQHTDMAKVMANVLGIPVPGEE